MYKVNFKRLRCSIFLMNGIPFYFCFNITALHYAIIENNIEFFNQILQFQDLKIDIRDNMQSTYLHWTARYGRIKMVKEILIKSPEFINEIDIYGIYIKKCSSNCFNFSINKRQLQSC